MLGYRNITNIGNVFGVFLNLVYFRVIQKKLCYLFLLKFESYWIDSSIWLTLNFFVNRMKTFEFMV